MTYTKTSPTVRTLPVIATGQLWRDEVLDITYRMMHKRSDGWYVRCIGAAGKVWYDVLHPETFVLDDLQMVN